MKNNDALQLMKSISEMKSELQESIGVVKAQNSAQLAKIDDLRRELLGPGGRVTTLETRLDRQEFWHNIKTIVVIPVVLSIHKIATLIGWNV